VLQSAPTDLNPEQLRSAARRRLLVSRLINSPLRLAWQGDFRREAHDLGLHLLAVPCRRSEPATSSIPLRAARPLSSHCQNLVEGLLNEGDNAHGGA
jgi:hypothetical protein